MALPGCANRSNGWHVPNRVVRHTVSPLCTRASELCLPVHPCMQTGSYAGAWERECLLRGDTSVLNPSIP